MAIVTGTLAHLPTSLGPCVLTVTYDDVTLALEQFQMSTPVEALVSLRRGNGQTWWDTVVAPGDHVQQAGGPVRNFADIADIRVGVTYG